MWLGIGLATFGALLGLALTAAGALAGIVAWLRGLRAEVSLGREAMVDRAQARVFLGRAREALGHAQRRARLAREIVVALRDLRPR